jgi:hypothetical protein
MVGQSAGSVERCDSGSWSLMPTREISLRLLPQIIEDGQRRHVRDPGELAGLLAEVKPRREALGLGAAPYEAIIEADSSGEFIELSPPDPAAWQAAGATWWIESWWGIPAGLGGLAEVRRRVQAGPPVA